MTHDEHIKLVSNSASYKFPTLALPLRIGPLAVNKSPKYLFLHKDQECKDLVLKDDEESTIFESVLTPFANDDNVSVPVPGHDLKHGTLKKRKIIGDTPDLPFRATELRLGRCDRPVTRIVADIPIKFRSIETLKTILTKANVAITIEPAVRRSTDIRTTVNGYGWDFCFFPPISRFDADQFLENLAWLLRVAERAPIYWTRRCYYVNDDLLEDYYCPWGESNSNSGHEMIELLQSNQQCLLNIATNWTDSKPDNVMLTAIDLINEVKFMGGYMSIQLAGQMAILEMLALYCAKKLQVQKCWQYDATRDDVYQKRQVRRTCPNCQPKVTTIQVELRSKLRALADLSRINIDDDIIGKLVKIRNMLFHGKRLDRDIERFFNMRRALSALLEYFLLGLIGFVGECHAYSIYNSRIAFPSNVAKEIARIKDDLMPYKCDNDAARENSDVCN